MDNNYNMEQESSGNVLRGLLGSLIGAVLGGIVWGVVGILTQRVFSLIGILLGFLIAKGYDLMKGRQGAVKIAVVIVCVVFSVVLGEAIYNVGMIHQSYEDKLESDIAFYLENYNVDVRSMLETNPDEAFATYLYTEKEIFQMYLDNEDYMKDVLLNLGQAMLAAAFGALVVIIDMNKKKPQPAPSSAAQESAANEEASSDSSISPEV